jgi:type IV pilus assembly protein PilB
MKHFRKTTNKHLGELLVERGILSRQQVQEAVDHQKSSGGLFGEVLVKLGYATEENIAQALTTQYGFPYLPLANYEIDAEVIKTVPENVCRQFCLIPIDKIGKSLTLAMSNPLNVQAAEDVELITGCTVQAFVATATDIKNSINKYYSLNK